MVLMDDIDEFEDWDDDSAGDEFEDVDDSPADPIATVTEMVPGETKRKRVKPPNGNTKRMNAREARRQAMREAQGRGPAAPQEWRDELAAGNRGKAAALLSKGGNHNSGSGFGLA